MIVELGHFALILALGIALLQCILPLWGAQTSDYAMMRVGEPASYVQLALLALSFGCLTYAHVVSDFSVINVVQNSYSAKPMLYKVAGVWGNHEGSMLLWVLILALFGSAVALFGNNLPTRMKANVLGVQASISVAFLLFIIITSNPFLRAAVPPADGQGMNPILQDPAMAFHPPFLYAGYVGFSMAFSFAVAALIEGRVDAAWARWVRPWTLAAWMFLTIGIAMGSWWAYYELGWGGWWAWDPVENASFMPWLLGTALLHSAIVVEKRDALKIWTILLSILTFSLSLMGTFIVRSGVLTSVHAFAVDPERGIFVLMIMLIFTGGALALFAWRAPMLKPGGIFAPISREGALVFNNLLLTAACATVFFGTLYPLLMEALGSKISVGFPFYNKTFSPLMVPLLLAMPLGPLLSWKRGNIDAILQRLTWIYAAVLASMFVTFAIMWRGPWLAPVMIGVAVWVILGALYETAYRVKMFGAPRDEVIRRLKKLPRSAYGMMLAHLGVGVMLLGIVGTSAWQKEKIVAMKPGETTQIAGYTLKFIKMEDGKGPNYAERTGTFQVMKDGRHITTLYPSKRVYTARAMPTTESGIYNTPWGADLYVVLGDPLKAGAHAVRIYFNPLVRLIWIGSLIMFIGGFLSLMDRRLRVGAPKQAKHHKKSGSAGVVPAE